MILFTQYSLYLKLDKHVYVLFNCTGWILFQTFLLEIKLNYCFKIQNITILNIF